MTALCPNHPTRNPRQADAGQLCSECVGRTRRQLLDMPALYDFLAAFLEPGKNGDNSSLGHRANPPIPANVDVLSLRQRGGILAGLATWEDDWRDIRGDKPAERGDTRQAVAAVVAWLDGHLGWAARHHPAVDEFRTEIAQLWRQAWSAAGLTRPPVVANASCFKDGHGDTCDNPCLDDKHDKPCGGELVKFWRDETGLDEKWECQLCGETYKDARYHLALRAQLEKEREHGTAAAYRRHLRRGEQPCDNCRRANRDAIRAHRAGRVA